MTGVAAKANVYSSTHNIGFNGSKEDVASTSSANHDVLWGVGNGVDAATNAACYVFTKQGCSETVDCLGINSLNVHSLGANSNVSHRSTFHIEW
jgi:hypothetical protein